MAKLCSIFVGQQYGYWTVLEDAGRVGANHCYLCRCACGNERVVVESALLKGSSKSCGCRKGDVRSNNIDLTGQTFGLWQVLAPAGRNPQGHKQYHCRCACGNERIVLESALQKGASKSCGCWRPFQKGAAVDLTGQTFGFWTVLGPVEKEDPLMQFYRCRCVCGKEYDITERALRSGHSKSCGCKDESAEDLTGRQFGYWTVLERAGPSPDGSALYLCRCRCGKEKIMIGSRLKRGDSQSCGCLRAERMTTTGGLVGQKFGHWTVIAPADPYFNGSKRYLCRCSYGTERIIVASNLIRGLTKSCGCRGKDRTQLKILKQNENSDEMSAETPAKK